MYAQKRGQYCRIQEGLTEMDINIIRIKKIVKDVQKLRGVVKHKDIE